MISLVMTWDVASGQRLAEYEGHAAGVNALAFSPDGQTLWSGGDDRALLAFDRQRADTLVHRASQAVTDGPPLPGNSVDMIIGPGGRYVAYPTANIVPFRIRDVARAPSARRRQRTMGISKRSRQMASAM